MAISTMRAFFIAALITLGSVPAWADITLTFGDDLAGPNPACHADVPLSMSGASGPVAGVQIDLLFPSPMFSLVNADTPCALAPGVPGSVFASLSQNPAPPSGMNRLRVIILDLGGATYTNGPLAVCQLKAASGSAQGVYSLQADRAAASDSSGNLLPATGVNGEITVTAPAYCCP